MRPAVRIICAIGLAGAAAAAFQTAQNGDRTFRVSVNLVQVDAVVSDARGRPVSDLGAPDFEVNEDGKPRKITNFSWIAVRPAEAARAGRMTAEDVRRSIVLMIDDSGPWAEQEVLPVIGAARNACAVTDGTLATPALTSGVFPISRSILRWHDDRYTGGYSWPTRSLRATW